MVARLGPDEQKALDEQKKAATERAQFIVNQCELEYMSVSKGAQEACKNVEEIFQACVLELGYILPNNFRTTSCLERMEEACMWAKKAICVHDKNTSKKENDGKANDNGKTGLVNGDSNIQGQ